MIQLKRFHRQIQRQRLFREFNKQKYLHFMIWPTIIWMAVFCYLPIAGLQIAFKDYVFNKGIWGSPWSGLKNFMEFFKDPYIVTVIRNTFALSLIKILIMIPATLIFAIMLEELTSIKFKRTIQTISYLPYFISWPIVLIIANSWFSPSTGFINNMLVSAGILKEPYYFLGDKNAFWPMMAALEMWKNIGWGAIIYLAAMAGINPELYEAADIDGVGRLRKIWNITIPGILPTIMIMIILNLGNMLSGGLFSSNFQQSYLFSNPVNKETAEILDTYILRVGISLGRYSYAAAVGLLMGIVSLIFLRSANFASNKLTGESLF
jgi:putative aldouronate transport system permease protein